MLPNLQMQSTDLSENVKVKKRFFESLLVRAPEHSSVGH